MALNVRIQITEDNIKRTLDRLKRDIPKAALRVLSARADRILRDVRATAPRDTGKLRDSFVKVATETIRIRGAIALVGTEDFRARFHEFGTRRMPKRPFVGPALDRHSGGLVEALIRELDRG